MLWLAHTVVCDKDATSYVVDMHKQSRRLTLIQSTIPDIYASDGSRVLAANLVSTYQSPRSALSPPRGNPTPFLSHGSANEERPLTEGIHDTHAGTPPVRHSQAPTIGSRESHGDDVRKSSYVHQYLKSRKFTGVIDQSVEIFIRDLKICSPQYRLSNVA